MVSGPAAVSATHDARYLETTQPFWPASYASLLHIGWTAN
jgi:hypothetical protein